MRVKERREWKQGNVNRKGEVKEMGYSISKEIKNTAEEVQTGVE